MTKTEYSNECNCPQSLKLQVELAEKNDLIKALNDHRPETAKGGRIGIVTYLLPVERVKIENDRKRLKQLEEENQELRRKNKQLNKWLKVISIWHRNLKEKYEACRREI